MSLSEESIASDNLTSREPSPEEDLRATTPIFPEHITSYFTQEWLDSSSNHLMAEREVSPFTSLEGSSPEGNTKADTEVGAKPREATPISNESLDLRSEWSWSASEISATSETSGCDSTCSHYPQPYEVAMAPTSDAESESDPEEESVKIKTMYSANSLQWGKRRFLHIEPATDSGEPAPKRRVTRFIRGDVTIKRVDSLPRSRWEALFQSQSLGDLARGAPAHPLPSRVGVRRHVKSFVIPRRRIYLRIVWGDSPAVSVARVGAPVVGEESSDSEEEDEDEDEDEEEDQDQGELPVPPVEE